MLLTGTRIYYIMDNEKILSVILLCSILAMYGCTCKASDIDTSRTTESYVETISEAEPVTTEATATGDETNVDDALKAVKTVGEALEILCPEVSFELSDLKYIFFDSDDYDGKSVAFRDAEIDGVHYKQRCKRSDCQL